MENVIKNNQTTNQGAVIHKCKSVSCYKKNTFDWLFDRDIKDIDDFNIVEVSFKNGARKEFYINPPYTKAETGDMVVVDSGGGKDIGRVTLSGELVKLQMSKKKIKTNTEFHKILRKASDKDLIFLEKARSKEKAALVKARVIVNKLKLDMKLGDIEFQSDDRKATFYYTADGRVDFRELIKYFAKEFKIRVEMRQIGARQESSRIGGIGSCGRELCCSTWLSDFKSVTTSSARYQNIAINQAKLTGHCGRLKCCLNFELDTYMEALEQFPDKIKTLNTDLGKANLIKVDIFKKLMFFAYEKGKTKIFPLTIPRVKEIFEMNNKGEMPIDLVDANATFEKEHLDFDNVIDNIELPAEAKPKKKRRRRRNKKWRNKKKK